MGEPSHKKIVGIGEFGRAYQRGEVDSGTNLLEIVTESYDPALLGIGSSPYIGDVGNVGLVIPVLPTVDQAHRYLFRLCSIQVSNNRLLVVRGLRQLLTIGGVAQGTGPGGQSPPCIGVPVDFDVTSPDWHFVDGNVSWHLRWENDTQTRVNVADPNQLPGTSPSLFGTDAALLYQPPLAPIYNPPGAGIPPGADVGRLGTWHDIRYPWRQTTWELEVPVRGPGTLVFYASVQQTDADTRCPIKVSNIDVLRPEDKFVAGLESTMKIRYRRIAGALTVELFPCYDG